MASKAQHSSHSSYIRTYWILVALLAISVVGPILAPFAPGKGIATFITLCTAFGIAIVKALMVAGRFMHLDKEYRIIWRILITCVLLMFVLFAAVAPDVMKDNGQNWESTNEFKNNHGSIEHHH